MNYLKQPGFWVAVIVVNLAVGVAAYALTKMVK